MLIAFGVATVSSLVSSFQSCWIWQIIASRESGNTLALGEARTLCSPNIYFWAPSCTMKTCSYKSLGRGNPLRDPRIIISNHYAGNHKARHIPPSWATVPFLRQQCVLHSAIIASQKGQSQSRYNIQPPFPNSEGPSGVGERGFAEVVGC